MKIKRWSLKYSLSFLHSWLPYDKEYTKAGKRHFKFSWILC